VGTTSIAVADELFTRSSFEVMKPGGTFQTMRSRPTFLADALIKGKGRAEGGHTAIIPYAFDRHSEPTQITQATQYRVPNLVARPQMRSGSDTWAFVAQPMFIGSIDREFKDRDGQITLAKVRTADVNNHAREALEVGLLRTFASSGSFVADNAVTQFSGFNTLNGTDSPTGIVEGVPSGTNTVHGISRSVYPVTQFPRFHGVVLNALGAAATNLFDGLVDMQNAFTMRGGSMAMTSLFGHPDFSRVLTRILRPSLQVATIDKASENYGLSMLFGKPVTPVALPTDGTGTTALPWSCLGLTIGSNGLQLTLRDRWSFSQTPWQTVPGTVGDCQVSFLLIAGQVHDLVPGNRFLIVRANT
jgi:hypothetical protein